MKLSKATRETIAASARANDSAGWAVFVGRQAGAYGVAEKTIYRVLRAYGLGPQRTRCKGSSQAKDDEVLKVHHLISASKRRNGQILMDTKTAVEILQDSGQLTSNLSPGTWSRRLREMNLSAAFVRAAKPHRLIETDHPNHVFLMDATPCVMYRVNGKGHFKTVKDFNIEVSRKPQDLREIKRHVIRYCVVDHKSGAFYVRYYNASGEKVEDVLDCLFRAMAPKDDPKYPFRGVPMELWTDPGSAFTAAPLANLCEALGVTLRAHMAGNPRAKGAVEVVNKLWPMWFESRLSLQAPETLEELNAWATDYLVRKNMESSFRREYSRTKLWMNIGKDQLRELPTVNGTVDKEFFGRLAATEPVTRVARANLMIAYGGNEYRLPNRAELAGHTLHVHLDAWSWPCAVITAFKGTEREERFTLAPIERDKYGTVVTVGATQKPGEPRAVSRTPQEEAQAQGEEWLGGYGVEHKGTGSHRRAFPMKNHEGPRLTVFGHQAAKVPDVALLPRQGVELERPDAGAPMVMRHLDAIEVMGAELGRGLFMSENEYIREQYPQGMTEADIAAALAFFTKQDMGAKVVNLR